MKISVYLTYPCFILFYLKMHQKYRVHWFFLHDFCIKRFTHKYMHRLLYEGLVNANHCVQSFFFFCLNAVAIYYGYLWLGLFWIWAFVYRENDTGVLSYKEHLPVQEIVIGDTYRQDSEAMYVVGPLQCSGDSTWTQLICSSVVKHDVWKQEEKENKKTNGR